MVLFTTAHLGIPVSTTHSITGSIMGVGASMNASAVRWGVAGNIFVAWILTIPCSFIIAGGGAEADPSVLLGRPRRTPTCCIA